MAGKFVCKKAFADVHGFSLSRLQRAVSKGKLIVSRHGNRGKKRLTSTVEEAKIWMERYFHLIGDKQPDKDEDIFHRYEDDMRKTRSSESLAGLSTFYRIWNENVLIPKV